MKPRNFPQRRFRRQLPAWVRRVKEIDRRLNDKSEPLDKSDRDRLKADRAHLQGLIDQDPDTLAGLFELDTQRRHIRTKKDRSDRARFAR